MWLHVPYPTSRPTHRSNVFAEMLKACSLKTLLILHCWMGFNYQFVSLYVTFLHMEFLKETKDFLLPIPDKISRSKWVLAGKPSHSFRREQYSVLVLLINENVYNPFLSCVEQIYVCQRVRKRIKQETAL